MTAPPRAVIAGRTLELVRGDITREEVDAIANAANAALAGGGGVDGAIHEAGGPAIMAELRARYRGCATGSAVATGAGRLKARHVLHAVGPRYRGRPEDPALLAGAYRACLRLCEELSCRSVAFPSISTGVYGFPVAEAAPVALGAMAAHLAARTLPELVRFVLFDDATLAAYAGALEELRP